MDYGDGNDVDDGGQPRTAFREAEKKYQLHRERKMKIKGGRLRPGKMIVRPIDMSEVLDVQSNTDLSTRVGLARHDVPGYEGPVYTFAAHPGLVYMPGALPAPHQEQLAAACLGDFPDPPARTNHELQYGPLPGLWRAAQEGLRLNWGRKDDPRTGGGRRVGCVPPKPHRFPESAPTQQQQQQQQQAECGGGDVGSSERGEQGAPNAHAGAADTTCESSQQQPVRQQQQQELTKENGNPHATGQPPQACGGEGCGNEGSASDAGHASGIRACSGAGKAGKAPSMCCGDSPYVASEPSSLTDAGGGESRCGEGAQQHHQQEQQQRQQQQQEQQELGTRPSSSEEGMMVPSAALPCASISREGSSGCSGGGARTLSRVPSSSCCAGEGPCGNVQHGTGSSGRCRRSDGGSTPPSFEEAWSVAGAGPAAEQLMRKLRWATLGPQFNWTERQYDFTRAYRPLPSCLESIALRMAAVARAAQRLQAAAAGDTETQPSVSGGYKPDAAIVNFYQQGDVLGGHLDDVERDMGQPIVSVSLGCPAVFLMGGPTKQQPPSALLLRGGDVLVLAGQARRCYHGVPRILEHPDGSVGTGRGKEELAGGQNVQSFMRCARINISIRAVC